ncbi:MAG: acetolactate synthase [Clostridiaceae bacterium]|nr:acetolactate synthase [Clostridiaceae bacterium]
MLVKQVSVFLENKFGRLADVSRILGENSIDIRALSIADTTEYGILRIIVDKPDYAVQVLKEKGFSVRTTEVIAVSVADKPGGLLQTLEVLKNAGIPIEYMYAFIGNIEQDKAIVILRVDDTQKAVRTLQENNIEIYPSAKIYNL